MGLTTERLITVLENIIYYHNLTTIEESAIKTAIARLKEKEVE